MLVKPAATLDTLARFLTDSGYRFHMLFEHQRNCPLFLKVYMAPNGRVYNLVAHVSSYDRAIFLSQKWIDMQNGEA